MTARVDLLRWTPLRSLLTNRWSFLVLRAVALGGYLLVLLAGWIGTPVGNRNLSVVLVWIAWWALLMLLAVPLFGRAWCAICPVPMPGEWLQQGAVLAPPGPGARRWELGRRWPRLLRNTWLQTALFLTATLFGTVVLTQPRITALVLTGLLLAAIGTSLVFERRTFCRHVCPVGSFIGLYAQTAPLEVRVRDTAVCAGHREKTCYSGSSDGYGCPWNIFPAAKVKNVNCGLCLECVQTCPHDNVGLFLRTPGADLAEPRGRRADEAAKALVLIGSAGAYSAVMLGPWNLLKSAASAIGSPAWWGFAVAMLTLVLGVTPGVFYLAVRAGLLLSGAPASGRRAFVTLAYTLVPLGLAAWIAFSLGFVFASGSYLLPVLSDPMGWGWDLFGTAGTAWTPVATGIGPALQAVVLLGGFAWSARTAMRLARELDASVRPERLASPVVAFQFLTTLGMLWLLVG